MVISRGVDICWWYVSFCCWWPWKLICSYWARPWRTSVSAKLPPFDGKNGPTKCCNPTLCDLFRQIWTFLWKTVLDSGERQGLSVFLKLSQNVLPSSPCDSGFRWMNDRVRLTCQPTLSSPPSSKLQNVHPFMIPTLFMQMIKICALCKELRWPKEGAEVVLVTVVSR